MALKIYDTFAPQGDYPAVKAKDVEMPDGTRLSDLNPGGGSGGSITVDSALDPNSENPVQNKVIAALVEQIGQMIEGLTPDAELSETSLRPVQNKVIYAQIQQAGQTLQTIVQSIPTDTHINELIDTYLSEALGGDY